MIGRSFLHYRVLRHLGGGGMGEVYLAQDTKLQRRVAVKVLPPELSGEPHRRRRFDRESKVLATLNHPNIVTVHSVEEVDGVLYLVMEWIDGCTLGDKISPVGLSLREALQLYLPAVEAVAAAHRAGVVHRDLKPDNVMVRQDGVVKVVDFGLSKQEDSATIVGGLPQRRTETLTQEGTMLGTVHYMSPEGLDGRTVDARSDVFALGVILYEMLTGQRPFGSGSPFSVVTAILRDSPRPLRRAGEELPPRVLEIVERCLVKDPAQRYQDAGALKRDLASLSEELEAERWRSREATPSEATPADAALVSRSWFSGPLRVVVGVSLLLLLVGAFALWRFGPRSSPVESQSRSATLHAGEATETPHEIGVAVLPLRTAEPADAYLAEGATDGLIASLAKIGALRVVAHSSLRQLEGRKLEPRQIAAQLGVDYLLDGTLTRTAKGHFAVVVQLLEPRRNQALWGDTFSGSLTDLLSFEARSARQVARAVQVEVTREESARLARRWQLPVTAYRSYLEGLHELAARTPVSVQKALGAFQQVNRQAPDFAPGWVGTAQSFLRLSSYGYAVGKAQANLGHAEQAAKQALSLDRDSSSGYGALATIHFSSWHWQGTEEEFQRAIALNPSNASARLTYAAFLTALGRHQEALSQIRQARRLDPLSPIVNHAVSVTEYFAGDYQESIAQAEQNRALAANFWLFPLQLGLSQSLAGNYAQADGSLREAGKLGNDNPFVQTAQAINLKRWGHDSAAAALVQRLDERVKVGLGYVPPSLLAKVHLAMGDRDAGFRWLRRGLEERDPLLCYLAVDPDFRPYSDDPRFREALSKIGLSGAADQ